MTLDRTGEPIEQPTPEHRCRDGWLSPPDADVAVLCPCRQKSRAATTSRNTNGK